MKNMREWAFEPFRLGRLQEAFAVTIALFVMFTFSFACTYIMQLKINSGASINEIFSIPLMFIVAGFAFANLISVNLFRLAITMYSDVDSAIRFDAGRTLLNVKSTDDMLTFIKKHKIAVYISKDALESEFPTNVKGKYFPLFHDVLQNKDYILKYISKNRVFFKKSDFDLSTERNQNTTQEDTNNVSKGIEAIKDRNNALILENAKISSELKEEKRLHGLAKNREDTARERKQIDLKLFQLAVRVSARLGMNHSNGMKLTKSQVATMIANTLNHDDAFIGFRESAEAESKAFAKRVRDGLPSEMVNTSGAPKQPVGSDPQNI